MNGKLRGLAGVSLALVMVVISGCSDDKTASQGGKVAAANNAAAPAPAAADSADLAPAATSGSPLQVSLVKPNGAEQSAVSQIVVMFNKKMVSLGDMEKAAENLPVSVSPEPGCHWRWLNTTTLACWLDRELPHSTAYEVKIGPEIKALDGTSLGEEHTTTFSTATVKKVNDQVDFTGPEHPVITVALNQPVKLSSLQEKSRISCGSFQSHDVKVSQLQAADEHGTWDSSRSYHIEPVENLDADTSCRLEIDRGVEAEEGPMPSQNKMTVSFHTYPDFYVREFNCGWENKVAGTDSSETLELKKCDPEHSVNLSFSVPVANKDFAGKLKIDPDGGWSKGGYNSPEYMRDNPDETFNDYRLNSPFEGVSSYRIDLDKGLVDIFGRPLKGATRLTFATTHFPPSLEMDRDTAVIEKFGPHLLGYTGVNINNFRVRLFSSNQASDFDYLKLNSDYSSRCDESKFDPRNRFTSRIVKTDLSWDSAVMQPLDFDKLLPQYGSGFIIGRVDTIHDMNGSRIDVQGILRTPNCPDTFMVQITDLGITSKLGYFNGGAWVNSLKTGMPVAAATVELIDPKGKVVFSGKSDAQGFVALPGMKEVDPTRQLESGGWTVAARTADDFSFVRHTGNWGKWNQGINPWDFNISTEKLTRKNNFLMQAITDRPLYKPGDEVRIKIFARQWDNEKLKLLDPEERAIKVSVENYAQDKVLEPTLVTLNDFSTGTVSFKLPRSAATGTYTINVTNALGHTLSRQDAFSIEEYRLPPFKVNLATAARDYALSSLVPVSGDVSYHFGGRVKNASGTINATFTATPFSPRSPELTAYRFGMAASQLNWWDIDTGEDRNVSFLRESIRTDNDGLFRTAIALPKETVQGHGRVTVEAGFPDDTGKMIANRTSFDVHPSRYYLGLKAREWVYKPGEDLGIDVVAADPEEKLVTGRKVKMTLLHRIYNTVRRRGEGNYFHYDTVTEDKEVGSCEVTTSMKGESCRLAPESAGYYIVKAESTDSDGNRTESSISTYVTGPEYIGWWRQDHDRIDLIPDKPEYTLGDKLRLLVKSPYDKARALITIERHGILHREERELVGGAQVIEFPLDRAAYAPGFYVSVVLIKGRTSEKIEGNIDLGKPSFKMGMVRIPVSDPGTRLQVSASTRAATYKPGETVEGEIRVRTAKGKGVESEVALAVVDEALLQLVADYERKYEVHDVFYKVPELDVSTSETLIHLLGRRHFGKKGAAAGGGGGEAALKLREAFKAVAYWEPAIMTDADGVAHFSFKAPDNLTGWRLIAVAVDRNQRFGHGGGDFKVNKPIMLESALPNFATEGDAFDARFVVHNRTEAARDVDVSLKAKGLQIVGSDRQATKVGKDDKAIVQFPVKVPRGDKAVVEVRAMSDGEGDGMRLTLPIAKFVSLDTFATYGSTTAKQVEEDVAIPKGIRTDVGGIELLLSSSVLAQLDETFRYVFAYPYDCWEQQITRALMYRNNVELADYVSEKQRVDAAEAGKHIGETLEKAGLYQASNGGFAYWKPQNELADPYLSAYTALAFQWLASSGYQADEAVSKRLNDYLGELLRSDSAWPRWYTARSKATIRAMILYVMSKQADKPAPEINRAFKDRDLLSLFGRGFLLMAAASLGEDGRSMVKTLEREIMNQSEITSGKVQFREEHDDGFARILHTTTRSNCLLLSALTEVDPRSVQLTPLMRFISESRKQNRWYNTQENLYCLNAMVDYARVYERDKSDQVVSGSFGDRQLGRIEIKGKQSNPHVMSYAFEATDAGRAAKLMLKREGSGRLYYTARMRIAYEKVRSDPVNSGMGVERTYFVRDGDAWTPVQGDVQIHRGDLVRVQLKVKIPSERLFVALNDPLPAGLEPVNAALASASTADAASGESNNSAGSYVWNEDDYWEGAYRSGGFYHREMRLQAVQYFADFIAPGDYELNYVAQAIATGTFSAGPSLVEEMYSPETYGKGTPAKFIVSEK